MQSYGIESSIMLDPIQGMLQDGPAHNIVHKGCSQFNPTVYSASSFSSSNINFSQTTPGSGTLIDRRLFIKLQATFNFVGTVTAGNLLDRFVADLAVNNATTMGLRAYPLSSVTNNLSLTLNGNTTSTQLNRYVNSLGYLVSDSQLRSDFTGIQYPDQNQLYSQSVATNNSEFSNYGSNWFGSRIRGPEYQIVNNGTTSAQVIATWYEPVMIPPLVWNREGSIPGLGYVNTFNIDYGLNNLSHMWSAIPFEGLVLNMTALSISSVSIDSAELHINYYTPSAIKSLPPLLHYNAPQIYPINQDSLVPVAPGDVSPKSILSSSIQLVTIPSKIVIYVSKKLGSADFYATDALCAIDQLQITLNNQPMQLGRMSTFDLFKMSRRNGVNLTWEQFSKKTGSVVVLDLNRSDLVMSDSIAVGSLGSFQFQVDCRYHSLVPAAESTPVTSPVPSYLWSLNTVFIYEQFCIIDNTANTSFISGINPSEYLNLVLTNQIDPSYSEFVPGTEYIGGSFWSSFKEGLSKAIQLAKKVAQKAPGYIQQGQDIFNKYALPIGMAVAPEFTAPAASVINEGADFLKGILPKLVGQGLSLNKVNQMFPNVPRIILENKYNKELAKQARAGALVGGRKKKGGALVGGKKVLKSRMY